MKDIFNLTGRRALVTGSSQGIGRASAVAKAEATRREIEAYGVRCAVTVADLVVDGGMGI